MKTLITVAAIVLVFIFIVAPDKEQAQSAPVPSVAKLSAEQELLTRMQAVVSEMTTAQQANSALLADKLAAISQELTTTKSEIPLLVSTLVEQTAQTNSFDITVVDELKTVIETLKVEIVGLKERVTSLENKYGSYGTTTPAPKVQTSSGGSTGSRPQVMSGGSTGTYAPVSYAPQTFLQAPTRGHWTFPGTLDNHLAREHGVNPNGMSREQMLNLHDSLHENTAYSVMMPRTQTFSVLNSCPPGGCPPQQSGYVRRGLLGFRR